MPRRGDEFIFLNDWRVAGKDMQAFELWAKGEISAEAGADRISLNNRYPCSPKQFVRLARSLGYFDERR